MPRAFTRRARIVAGWLRVWLLGVETWLARMPGLRRLHRRHLRALVRATGLFDADWYLRRNQDVLRSGIDPLSHYVRHGDREGRRPMALFDPQFYRSHAGRRPLRVNALLHYAYLGRFRRISPSVWFDVAYYLKQNRDVARSGEEPLRHYLREGGASGRSPCRQFDADYYLRSNPDVALAGTNPLLHYLETGRLEGRAVLATLAEDEVQGQPSVPRPPPPDDWSDIPLAVSGEGPCVDIVVPVYSGHNETLHCLRSVLLAPVTTRFELIVIDDDSPDVELASALARHAEQGLFTLLRNESNRGFVRSANRGLQLHPERDVILLNADTEVFGDWLDRLRTAALRHPHTGTVTPLSNNATIASYPRTLHENPYPLEIGYEALDRLAAQANAGVEVEAPTGVGFCMYLRRDCLAETGLFDEEAFGRGYGEENDLCQRALARGWRNVIAADVFVHHLGSVSFKGERARRVDEAMRVMDARHPDYQPSVRRFIDADPLLPARRALDRARMIARAGESSALIVCHARGGGAERHVIEEAVRLRKEGRGVFYLRPVPAVPGRVRLTAPAGMQLPNLGDFALADTAELAAVLRELRIDVIHDHGTVDFPVDMPQRLLELARTIGARIDVDVHDYELICPRINLVNGSGRYCGEPGVEGCNTCLAGAANDFGARDIVEWRAGREQLVRAADAIWVPDADVAERLQRYFPGVGFSVDPHEALNIAPLRPLTPLAGVDTPLRIVVIGAIGKIKGYEVLLACARDAARRRLPLSFSVLGYSMNDTPLMNAGVTLSGRYLETEAAQKLAALEPHAVWLPSIWPETYSYTLSLALEAGYPVFAFDIGAIARRLRDAGRSDTLMPLVLQDDPGTINARFLEFRAGRRTLEAMRSM